MAVKITRIAAQLALLGAFVAALAVYCFKTYLNVVEDAAELPKFRVDHFKDWKDYPDEFTKSFEDRVAWKHLQVRRYARFKLDTWGVSPTPRVWVGDDGWLFYNHEADSTYVPATDHRLAARRNEWTLALSEWRAWLAERGIRLQVVVAPNKQSVYTEYLPAVERKRIGPTPLDILLTELRARDPAVAVLDLRQTLQEGRVNQRLYFKSDTHWNPYGILVGYRSTAHALGIEPLSNNATRTGTGATKHGDLPRQLGYWPLEDEPFDHIEITSPRSRRVELTMDARDEASLDYLNSRLYVQDNEKLPKVVLFHDSFGDGIYSELLAEHFGRLLCVPSNHMDPDVITREKPDIVILEIVERLFQGIGSRRPTDPPRRSLTR